MLLNVLALLLSAPTQQPSPLPHDEVAARNDEALIAQRAALGALLYDYDRAAWVATDALTARVPKSQLSGAGGYVVERATDATLDVTFYRGDGDAARAFFVAQVRDGKVADQTLLDTPVALTAAQAALARARHVAAMEATRKSYRPCTPAPFNTVVLPVPGDRTMAVYLLSAQQDTASYPMGGAYRVIVGRDGSAVSARPYSVSCLNMPLPKPSRGKIPVGLVVTHLLDPVPTEIHVFASLSLGVPLFVITSDKQMWQVRGSSITRFAVR